MYHNWYSFPSSQYVFLTWPQERAFNERGNYNDRQRGLGKYFGVKWCLRLGVRETQVHDLKER